MFEELRFPKITEDEFNILYRDDQGNYIKFEKYDKDFASNCFLSMNDLKAINKKCEELGWMNLKKE